MRRARRRFFWAVLCLGWLCAGPALAQRTTATLFGIVIDPSGASVPGAKVRLVNAATNAELAGESDATGSFTVTFIPVGVYRMEVEARGFKIYRESGMSLSAGQQLQLRVRLELGSAAETVEVTAEAPLVENASPSLADRVSRLQLSELPQSRRDFAQLLGLQNGYRPSRDGLIQFNGLASGGNSVTVDGTDGSSDSETPSTSMFQGFNFISVVSQEAIQEVVTSKGAMSAEVGRTYSANINVITRGGTNEFHGSLFELWQNDVLNAKNAIQGPTERKPVVRFNQFGGSLGGPVKRDKLFFFFTYEGYRMSNQTIQTGQVPTPAFRAAATAALPAYRAVLDLFPLPNLPFAENAQVGVWRGIRPATAQDNHWVGRVDYRLGNADSLTARYIRDTPENVQPRYMDNPRRYQGVTNSLNVNWIHGAPRWTNEARFGHNRNQTDRLDQIHSIGRIPAVEVQGLFDTQGEALTINGSTTSFENVVSQVRGRHTLKFGGVHVIRTPGRFNEEVPVFRFGNAADFLANRANRVTFTFGTPRYYGRAWEIGGFLQDDFRIHPRLVLNLGVRYEYFSVFKERDGRLFNPDGVYWAMERPVRFRPANSIYNGDFNNVMPRVGFAWSVDRSQRTVIRSGFGVFVAPPNLRALSGLVYAEPNIPTRYRFQSAADITRFNLRYPMSNEQAAVIVRGLDVPRGYNVVDPNNRDPYSMQWSFDIQRQIGKSLTFQTGYVGNRGLKITASHNFNLPDRITGVSPFPQSLQIGWRNQSDFSYYHGWQSSLRKRFGSGLQFNVHYTWSKSMAVHVGDFWPGNDARVQDETNWDADLGPTAFDVTHRVVGDWVWQTPFERWMTGRVWRGLFGGWQLTGTFTAQTGGVLNIEQRSNLDFSRPDYVGGDPYARGDRFQWINPGVFRLVEIGRVSGLPVRPGNVGKNSMRGPATWGINAGLGKTFIWQDRFRFHVRAEAFSVLNHPLLGNPVTDLTRPTFGRILGMGGTRTMQLQGRFQF
ncbi:MAG: TonB-dependent receptor [Bryobacteraceae bacterium]|nr:TonB-dependent receptor [Bryobacteraceae bacterium]MDW8378432.1 TonB-dependent receptor [Bryobacterales bacterium]